VSNRAYDRILELENEREEYACCECGYMRRHEGERIVGHPGVRCPSSGRCGHCGNDWPCAEHRGQAVGRSRGPRRTKSPETTSKEMSDANGR
jgi:hypothetical protein